MIGWNIGICSNTNNQNFEFKSKTKGYNLAHKRYFVVIRKKGNNRSRERWKYLNFETDLSITDTNRIYINYLLYLVLQKFK